MEKHSYSIAIRTLGYAGGKYLKTLQSCACQSIQPEHIYVCIPHGYPLPKETIGKEEYIRCEKGMVAQRAVLSSLSLSEEFILFLDDDLSFSDDFVQTLFDELYENHGDVIGVDVYRAQEESFSSKIHAFFSGAIPHWDKNWAFKIRKNSCFCYNNHPQKRCLLTQSACGAVALCRVAAFEAIHFEDEHWMDILPYAWGEDQLFFYKFYSYGYRVLVSYDACLKHLDARSGRAPELHTRVHDFAFARYCLWYRSIYSVQTHSAKKIACWFSFWIMKPLREFPYAFLRTLKHCSAQIPFFIPLKASLDARIFMQSPKYKSFPSYFAHRKSKFNE